MNNFKQIIGGVVLLLLIIIAISLIGSFITWSFWHPFSFLVNIPKWDNCDRGLFIFFGLILIGVITYVLSVSEFHKVIFRNTKFED